MKIATEVYWDKGHKPLNQDSVSVQEIRVRGKKVLFVVVCDGIGGLQQGEKASGYVTERMTEWFYKECVDMLCRRKGTEKMKKAGLRALYGCNEELRQYGAKQDMKMGTTLTMLLLQERKYILWHSGDTRAYRIRTAGIRKQHSRIQRLTVDHTADNRTLIRCIGSFSWKEPDVCSGKVGGKEIIVLCSDGFRNRIKEEQLGEALHPRYVQNKEQLRRCMGQLASYVRGQGEMDDISAVAMLLH